MKRIGIHMTRRSLVVGLCLAVVVAVGMALGSRPPHSPVEL